VYFINTRPVTALRWGTAQPVTVGDPDFGEEFGLVVTEITMNISLPEEITQAMTAGVARGVEEKGYLTNLGPIDRYRQVRAADAMLAAAANPGGGTTGDFVQAGLGVALAGQMAGQMQAAMSPGAGAGTAGTAGATPPPLPGGARFHVDAGGQLDVFVRFRQ
jgi:membrane protease subunit (stomatin/prohibitin family)